MLTVDRYQSGEKPAWILEIEEARATSSGAIGQSEAWACNSWQQNHQQQQQQYVEQQENQQEGEIDNKKHEAEEKSPGNVRSSDDTVVENQQTANPATAPIAPEQLSDEKVTSQQQPISADVAVDVISHTVQDLCDVSVVSQTQQGMEHVTMTRDPQYESPPVSVCSDVMTSHTADITEFSSHHTADVEVCQSNELTSGDVITDQQLATEDQDKRSAASEQLPSPSPPSSTSSSPTSTATVARQQTALSSNTTPTTLVAADDGRGKKRHSDKSKMNNQSADVRIAFIVCAFYQTIK